MERCTTYQPSKAEIFIPSNYQKPIQSQAQVNLETLLQTISSTLNLDLETISPSFNRELLNPFLPQLRSFINSASQEKEHIAKALLQMQPDYIKITTQFKQKTNGWWQVHNHHLDCHKNLNEEDKSANIDRLLPTLNSVLESLQKHSNKDEQIESLKKRIEKISAFQESSSMKEKAGYRAPVMSLSERQVIDQYKRLEGELKIATELLKKASALSALAHEQP